MFRGFADNSCICFADPYRITSDISDTHVHRDLELVDAGEMATAASWPFGWDAKKKSTRLSVSEDGAKLVCC